jgi:hypothetical protein
MSKKLQLIRKTARLACNWVPTGDPKMPLACVWTGSKAVQASSTESSADENGRIHLCA